MRTRADKSFEAVGVMPSAPGSRASGGMIAIIAEGRTLL
jgi:hypothetical protein